MRTFRNKIANFPVYGLPDGSLLSEALAWYICHLRRAHSSNVRGMMVCETDTRKTIFSGNGGVWTVQSLVWLSDGLPPPLVSHVSQLHGMSYDAAETRLRREYSIAYEAYQTSLKEVLA